MREVWKPPPINFDGEWPIASPKFTNALKSRLSTIVSPKSTSPRSLNSSAFAEEGTPRKEIIMKLKRSLPPAHYTKPVAPIIPETIKRAPNPLKKLSPSRLKTELPKPLLRLESFDAYDLPDMRISNRFHNKLNSSHLVRRPNVASES
jgi:hypothetical protein